jgi:hypothetical protein
MLIETVSFSMAECVVVKSVSFSIAGMCQGKKRQSQHGWNVQWAKTPISAWLDCDNVTCQKKQPKRQNSRCNDSVCSLTFPVFLNDSNLLLAEVAEATVVNSCTPQTFGHNLAAAVTELICPNEMFLSEVLLHHFGKLRRMRLCAICMNRNDDNVVAICKTDPIAPGMFAVRF